MIFKNVQLVNHNNSTRVNLEIENSKIKSIKEIKAIGEPTKYILPGFFDTHTHGGYGLDFNDYAEGPVSKERYEKYLNGIYSEGVIHVAATTVTATKNELINIATNFKKNLKNSKAIVAWYIEGPFISKEKKGAHNPDKIIPAEIKIIADVSKICTLPKIIAIAPEVNGNDKLVKSISKNNIVAIGHSDASADQTLEAMVNGASRIIHLYNQVSKFEHRSPGIINAAFLDIPLMCELICDGFHVNPLTIKNTYDIIGSERLMIITDSLSCKGLPNGVYSLGGLRTRKTDKIVYLDQTEIIAGSVRKYNDQVKIFKDATHCSMTEIVRMTSHNQWIALNKKDKSYLKEGGNASFVVADNNINILETIIDGVTVYKGK